MVYPRILGLFFIIPVFFCAVSGGGVISAIYTDILEFDAIEEPPSVLDVEVFDFEGPFDQASSLGHAEINFLKHTAAELADLWVPLDGKLAQSSQSKLHLRIFLDNNNGVETIRDYLASLEKEVGKKVQSCRFVLN